MLFLREASTAAEVDGARRRYRELFTFTRAMVTGCVVVVGTGAGAGVAVGSAVGVGSGVAVESGVAVGSGGGVSVVI